MGFIEEYGLVKYNEWLSASYPKSVPCEQCNRTHTYNSKPLRMVFDHCHDHGWIRGILCQDCNLGMIEVEKHVYQTKPKTKLEKELYDLHLARIKYYEKCPNCPPWEPYITRREYMVKDVIRRFVWMRTEKYDRLTDRQKEIFKSHLLFKSYLALGINKPFE